MNIPSVSICIPTTGTIRDQTAVSLAALTASVASRKAAQVRLDLVSGSAAVAWARNTLVRRSLAAGSDAVLFIDHDMVFPANALERLLNRNVAVCGAMYNKRVAEFDPVGRLVDRGLSIESGGIAEADELGCGMMLIRSTVFQQIPPPWFQFIDDPAEITDENPFGHVTEDWCFVRKCRAAGIKVYADLDLSMEMGHIGSRVTRWHRSGDGVPDVREDAT